MKKFFILLFIFSISSCSSVYKSNTKKNVGIPNQIEIATIKNIVDKKITPENTNNGFLVGAGLGVIIYKNITDSSNIFGTIGSLVSGGLLGSLMQDKIYTEDGLEFYLESKEENQFTLLVPKTSDLSTLQEGDKVILKKMNGRYEIIPALKN
jgi:outer membrane lipoprotein SlyB